MKLLPLRAWIEALLDYREKFPVPKTRKSRRSQIEPLEPRQMLSGTQLYWIGGTSGNWDTNAQNTVWSPNSSGGPYQAWVNGDQAIFGGAAAAISVASGITADSIQFNAGGYTISTPPLSSGSITLSGTHTINVATGLTDTISSPLLVGNGFVQTGVIEPDAVATARSDN